MKRNVQCLFSAGLFAIAASIGTNDVLAASLQVQPNASSVALGSTVVIDFSIADLNDLAAPSLGDYDFNISFNSNVLSYNNITWGSGLDPLGLGSLRDIDTAQAGTGWLNVFEVSLDDVDALQPDDFTLFTLTFNTVGLGNSPIALHINALGDGVGNALALDNVGSAAVSVNAVPVPAALPLFISGLLAASAFKRRRRLATNH